MRSRRSRAEIAQLRALLAKRIDEAAAETLDRGGYPASERLEELTRLERLVRLREAALASDRWRWAVPAVALVTLVALTILLFTRVGSTPVEIDLEVSQIGFQVGFRVPDVEALSNPMSVTALGVSGLTVFEMPGGDRRLASDLALSTGRTVRAGTLDVNPITVPAGTGILLRTMDGPRRYELILTGAVSELAVSANGPIRVVVPPDLDERQLFPFPRRINLEPPDSGEVRLDLTLSSESNTAAPFWTPLPVQQLSMLRNDEFEAPDRRLIRQVSTIRSGTVYFEALDGRTYTVRPGEELRFRESSGWVRQWQLSDSGIGVRFDGTVRGLSTGWEGARRSLMPTRLEWLRARHGVTLLWATTAYIVGAFITVLGWWKKQP